MILQKCVVAAVLLLMACTASARDVVVTMRDSTTQYGYLLGYSEENVYLEEDGKVVRLPVEQVDGIINTKNGRRVVMRPSKDPSHSERCLKRCTEKTIPIPRPSLPFTVTIEPFPIFVAELERQVTKSTTVAGRLFAVLPWFPDQELFPNHGWGGGLRYRFYLSGLGVSRGWAIGPVAEYLRDFANAPYWNAGVEFGYHFDFGTSPAFIIKILLDVLYESSVKQGEPKSGFRSGMGIGFGIGF